MKIDDRERKKEKERKGKEEKGQEKRESTIPGNKDAYTGDYKGVRLLSTHL